MISSKKIILVLLFFFIAGSSAMAITLTKDITEKVVVPFAVKGKICKWDPAQLKCLNTEEEIIFGRADVYPKNWNEPSSMLLFIFQDKLYRSVTISNKYYETNCHEEEIERKICKTPSSAFVSEEEGETCDEWETVQTKTQKCDVVGLANQSGSLSLVAETGTELYDNSNTYFVSYNEGTSKQLANKNGGVKYYSDDIAYLQLNLESDLYRSQSIDKKLTEEIIWYPK